MSEKCSSLGLHSKRDKYFNQDQFIMKKWNYYQRWIKNWKKRLYYGNWNILYFAAKPHKVGCFFSGHNTAHFEYKGTSDTLTPEKCINACQSKGFQFSGVTKGNTCICYNSHTYNSKMFILNFIWLFFFISFIFSFLF